MSGPPLTPLTWFLAALPLLLILSLMLALKWGGTRAAPLGWLASGTLAFLFFGTDPPLVLLASLKGLLLSLHVLYIIWPALLLYHVADEAGAISSIGRGVAALTKDRILQLLILGFTFPSFLQGVAGFGVPVAVAAPLLIGLGFPRLQATLVPLVGHAWAVSLGDLASSFQALRAVTELPGHALGLWLSTFLGVSCIATGFLVAYIAGGVEGITRRWEAILLLGIAMALTQFLLAFFDYWIIASFAAGMVGLTLGLILPSLLHYRDRFPTPLTFPLGGKAVMSFRLAFSAYLILIVVVALATLIPPLHQLLDRVALAAIFPEAKTALGWSVPKSEVRISLFGHPGALLLYASIAAYAVYRKAGYWEKGKGPEVLRKMAKEGLPTTIGIIFFVMMATVMNASGMTFLLAKGTIQATGKIYPLLSPFIGLLGCFVTGSNTNSNVLFGAFQRDAAILLGVNPAVMAALQSVGGSLGSMVAPAKVLLACATAGLSGKEGEVMTQALRYCLFLTAFIGGLGWLILLL